MRPLKTFKQYKDQLYTLGKPKKTPSQIAEKMYFFWKTVGLTVVLMISQSVFFILKVFYPFRVCSFKSESGTDKSYSSNIKAVQYFQTTNTFIFQISNPIARAEYL